MYFMCVYQHSLRTVVNIHLSKALSSAMYMQRTASLKKTTRAQYGGGDKNTTSRCIHYRLCDTKEAGLMKDVINLCCGKQNPV